MLRLLLALTFAAPLTAGEEPTLRLGENRFRHCGVISALAYTPDGKGIVAAGRNGISVFDATSGRLTRRIEPGVGWRCDVGMAVSPDGRYLFTDSWGDETQIWDLRTGRGRPELLRAVSGTFAPDGMLVLTGYDATIRLIDLTGRRKNTTIAPDWTNPGQVAVSPDGRTLAVNVASDDVCIVDVATGQRRVNFSAAGMKGVKIAFLPDSERLLLFGAVDEGSTHFRIYDLAEGRATVRNTLDCTLNVQTTPALSPDGSRLALSLADGTVVLFRTADGSLVRNWQAYPRVRSPGAFQPIAFSPDGTTLITARDELMIRRWDARTGREIEPDDGHRSPLLGLRFTSDGRELISLDEDGLITRWGLSKGETIARTPIPAGRPSALTSQRTVLYRPDPNRFALYDFEERRSLPVLHETDSGLPSHGESASEELLSRFRGSSVVIHDLPSGKVTQRIELPSGEVPFISGVYLSGCRLSEDGSRLGTQLISGCVFHSVHTGKQLSRVNGCSLEGLSPDGSTYLGRIHPNFGPFVSQSLDHRTRLVIGDCTTGSTRAAFSVEGGFETTAFSPDGALLTLGLRDRQETGHVRETLTGRLVWECPTPVPAVDVLAFSPDSRRLAVGRSDTTIEIWDLSRRSAR